MIIKKFQADTETEAVLMAKEEMGSGAVVLNIKTMKHRGISRLFKKDIVEVTAALEENKDTQDTQAKSVNVAIGENYTPMYERGMEEKMFSDEKANAIEEKLNNLQSILESRMKNTVEQSDSIRDIEKSVDDDAVREEDVNLKFLKLIYNQLIENEVDEKYANEIIGGIQSSLKKESNMDSILSAVYQKIILKIGQPEAIRLEENKRKVVYFVGPTGVGKTTTIAKLASYFKLEKKAKIALITSDTFRIAAVEQLRTYAGILEVPLKVIYTIDELNLALEEFRDYDLVLVDTAGRSHKNIDQCDEVVHLIKDSIVDENTKKEVYLVLSAVTKYRDLIKINEAFGKVKKYSIIFTKLDETTCLGNILNMKLRTGVSVSYVTSGQVVPDDISVLDPQKIARNILGSNE